MEQLQLFPDESQQAVNKVRLKGGSNNPIIFRDYESFVAKFSDVPKTTDDCYTPQDVYEAVVNYVGTICDMTDKVILRPFFPGGDFENAEYPENGVVIDNPPFSIFTKICRFYAARSIPFFLFGPALTIGQVCGFCTAVIASADVTFSNGARIKVNFATNLMGDIVLTTAPELTKAVSACKSQKTTERLTFYEYDERVLSVSDLQTMASGDVLFTVHRSECAMIGGLDLHPKGKGALYGNHWLISQAKAKAKAKAAIPIPLSPREERVCGGLVCLEPVDKSEL